MGSFIVDPQRSGRPRGGEEVDRHPSEHLVIRPGIPVRPIVQFLVDPRQQGDGGVGQRVAEGLRLGGLLGAVAAAGFEEPGCAGEAGAVAGGEGGEGVLKVEEWVRG